MARITLVLYLANTKSDYTNDYSICSYTTWNVSFPYISKLIIVRKHTMKWSMGTKIKLYAFYTLALDGGKWSSSYWTTFVPRQEVPQEE